MSIFTGKRIVVTGHTGFKGSWLVVMLRQLGVEVFGISADIGQAPPVLRNDFDRDHGFDLDLRDRIEISRVIKFIDPDLIFHLAAQSLVIDSYSRPVETFDINVIGTMNLLNAVSTDTKTKGVIVATTDKVYKNLEKGNHFSEDDSLGGYDPYSASKSCASILVSAWQRMPSFENKLIVDVRAGNVIGGGDRAENRLVPDLVRAATNEKIVEIRNPNSVRPWQHVLEPLHGYLLAGQKVLLGDKIEESYNFGPRHDCVLTVREVAGIFKKEFPDLELMFEPIESTKAKESQILKLDSTRALHSLNWQSKISPVDAIKKTISWEKAVLNNEATPLEITESQITDYLSTKF